MFSKGSTLSSAQLNAMHHQVFLLHFVTIWDVADRFAQLKGRVF